MLEASPPSDWPYRCAMSLLKHPADDAIAEQLAFMGETSDADRAWMIEYRPDLLRLRNTHEWCRGQTQPFVAELQDVPTTLIAWLHRFMVQGLAVAIQDVNDLPRTARTIQLEFQRQGNKSVLSVPVFHDRKLYGIIGFDKGGKERAVQELPGIVLDIMARSRVPGMAVAVVIGGKTVFAQGYGTREAGKDAPVDARTVFQIASISKSLSATVAAIEVSKGTVAWDDPVSRYLPDFKLSNAYVSEHAMIGDFFAHRSGLPGMAGDDLEDLGFKRSDVIARLRLLPLDAFRTSYHYANFSTTIGAEAVAKAAGRPWRRRPC